MRTQLLCTFSEKSECSSLLEQILDCYKLSDGKFFVFEDCKNPLVLMVTYNVLIVDGGLSKFPATISIHRKKQTNTLYTLNAMNKIIMEENGGVLDKSFQLDWEIYRNCLIITSESGYRIIDLRLIDIIRR
jgi:hypothetical protein